MSDTLNSRFATFAAIAGVHAQRSLNLDEIVCEAVAPEIAKKHPHAGDISPPTSIDASKVAH
jgi:hypothetical protein